MGKDEPQYDGHALGGRKGVPNRVVQQTFNSGSNRVAREDRDELFEAHVDEIMRKGRQG